MSWILGDSERRICPPEYQDHVNSIGGFNRYGEPYFRIVWGQSEFEVVRGRDAYGCVGAHTISKHGNIPSWFIEVWKPPECFGTPELWYSLGWDWELDTCTLGEYPWRGLYMPASFDLYVKKVTGGGTRYLPNGEVVEQPARLEIDAMPPNHWIIDLIIPNLLNDQEETYQQKKNAIERRMLAEKQEAAKKAMDAYLDAGPAFGGKAGTHESNREAWMQRIAEKQAGMTISAEEIKRRMGTGHMVSSRFNPTKRRPN